MKKLITFAFLLSSQLFWAQQNLVPNGSFEVDTACPYTAGQVYFARPWFQPNTYFGTVTTACSSELFNSCATNPGFRVPQNMHGYQYARSGQAYSGFGFYNDGGATTSREYIEVSLLTALETGRTYCVEFYVSLADSSLFAVANLEAYFCQDSLLYNSSTYSNIPVTAQIQNDSTNIINDTMNWTLISGQFIAMGGEDFMTIGNFHDNISTNAQNMGSGYPYGYYFVDDVSVVCCDCPQPPLEEFLIPTLLTSDQGFEIKGLPMNSQLNLFNSLGQLIYRTDNYMNDFELIDCRTGIYYYQLTIPTGEKYKGKIFILHQK